MGPKAQDFLNAYNNVLPSYRPTIFIMFIDNNKASPSTPLFQGMA